MMSEIINNPLSAEESREMMGDLSEGWLYGNGVGSTAITLGGVFLFPPYALYIAGNTLLSWSGYEPLHVTRLLPEQEREKWDYFYDNLSAAPGRLNAAVAGKEFVTKEAAQQRFLTRLKARKKRDLPPTVDEVSLDDFWFIR